MLRRANEEEEILDVAASGLGHVSISSPSSPTRRSISTRIIRCPWRLVFAVGQSGERTLQGDDGSADQLVLRIFQSRKLISNLVSCLSLVAELSSPVAKTASPGDRPHA